MKNGVVKLCISEVERVHCDSYVRRACYHAEFASYYACIDAA